MKLRIVSMVGLAVLFASAAAAQTKVAGKMQCPKPEVVGTAEAGDQAGHTLTLERNTCTWANPMEMVGEKSKDGTYVAFSEASPTRAGSRQLHILREVICHPVHFPRPERALARVPWRFLHNYLPHVCGIDGQPADLC